MASGGASLALAALLLVGCVAAAAATKYTVGDASGWTTTGDYATWASGKDFKVGDTLCECSALGKLAAIGWLLVKSSRPLVHVVPS